MKKYSYLLVPVLALTAAACGSNAVNPDAGQEQALLIEDSAQASGTVADPYETAAEADPARQTPFVSTLTDEGMIVTRNDRGKIGFMSGDFYEQPVHDEAEALEAVYSMIDEIGGREETELRHDLTATMGGVTYYTFVQTQDGMDSYEGVVKVATDQNGTVLGIVSSLRDSLFEEDSLFDPVDYHMENDMTAFFDGLVHDTLTQTVEYGEEGTKEITVPVSKDPKTGRTYLADVDRGVICVDNDDLTYEDEMTVLEPNADEFSDYELAYYDACIKVIDFYETKGWIIQNGHGSPLMLCIDRGTAGDPVPPSMASYSGYRDGFEHMTLSARLPNEINLSLLGHEYTHMVSDANHVGDYMNETGALNEGFSDIIGNAIEMSLEKGREDNWFDSFETEGKEAGYPNFVWDEYYTPDAPFHTDENDGGSVHHNSNCISHISLRLNEAGMSPEEQFDFWIQADLALTQDTDFRQLGERLPWCMEIAGYPQYEQALQEAIAEAGILDTSIPEEALPELALVRFDYPDPDFSDNHAIYLSFNDLSGNEYRNTWPEAETGKVAASLSPGYYYVYLKVDDMYADPEDQGTYYLYHPETGWEEVSADVIENYEFESLTEPIDAAEGEKLLLLTEGLPY